MNHQYRNRGLATGIGSVPASKEICDYIWQRDEGICIYCGNPANVLDHVIPWVDNGPSIKANLVCSCQKCNIYKSKHPRGLKQLTRAIFWLMTKGEDISWMDKFYPDIEASLKRPRRYIFDSEKRFSAKELRQEEPILIRPKISKNHNRNNRTTVIAFRLPNEVLSILKRRANKQGRLVSEYLRKRVIYDTTRKHHKRQP